MKTHLPETLRFWPRSSIFRVLFPLPQSTDKVSARYHPVFLTWQSPCGLHFQPRLRSSSESARPAPPLPNNIVFGLSSSRPPSFLSSCCTLWGTQRGVTPLSLPLHHRPTASPRTSAGGRTSSRVEGAHAASRHEARIQGGGSRRGRGVGYTDMNNMRYCNRISIPPKYCLK